MLSLHFLVISFITTFSVNFPLVHLSKVERFDNYRVYNLHLKSWKNVEFVRNLELDLDNTLEVLTPIRKEVPQEVSVLVSPSRNEDFTEDLQSSDITYTLVEENFQDVLEQDARINNLRAIDEGFGWDRYYRLQNIHNWLRSLESKHPGVVTTVSSGSSYEKRELLGIKISHGANNPAVFLEGGIHAREWISPATTTFIANELLTSENAEIRRLAQTYDWYIFPNVNPDGYVHTFRANRIWRKTRRPYSFCFGADPNRNWNHHWNEVGASSFSCSEVYAGPHPFSEKETSNLSTYIKSISNLRLYVSMHSYSQLLLYPYGTSDKVKNAQDYDRISNATVRAIAKRYGTSYEYGNIEETIYPASGGSIDWVHGVAHVPLAFTFELRPNSSDPYGFLLPPDQIIPTGEESMDGIVAMVQEAESLGYMN